jgi:hypothetical protein
VWDAEALFPRLAAHRQRLAQHGILAADMRDATAAAQCFPFDQRVQRPARREYVVAEHTLKAVVAVVA